MNKLWKSLSLGAGLLAYASFASFAEARLFDMDEFYLDNGLRVIVIPNNKAPVVQQMVWYKAGSADEQPGKGGSAHLLEHLMFRGTDTVKDNSFNKIIEDNGGEFNAFTSHDFTAYYEFVDISRLELVMFLEADRMRNLKITPDAFEKERDIVYQERKQVVENRPTAYFGESFSRDLWQEHPYARPVTGTEEEIQSLTIDDAQAFYDNFYQPENAVLVLSGDISYSTARNLAEKYYGSIENRKIGEKADFPKMDKFFETTTEMKLPHINTMRYVRSFIVPSFEQNKNKAFAFAVLAKYLGGGETSKLYEKLVLDSEDALTVSVSYDMFSRSYGLFTISALPAAGASSEEFCQEVDEALSDALTELTPEELQKTKKRMLAGLIYLKDDPRDAANIVGGLAAAGMSVEDIENYDRGIMNVTMQDIRAAADALLHSPNVRGVLAPEKGKNHG